jgi:peptidoglycan/xylan/chitin deacetylase (PgdA/CDA1 family)
VGTNNRRLAIAVAAAVVVAGMYAAGNALGRATDPAAAPAPANGESESRPDRPDAGEPDTGEAVDPAAHEAAAVAVPVEPAAAPHPVTGPGRPPLEMSGAGPHGTRRTTGDAYVALTFDDGPDPQWTPEVLELLRKHDVKATFCVVGQLARAYPELVREIAADGHTMCNHSWSHDMALGSRPVREIRADLERTTSAIRAAVPGARVSYYRQPGGAWTERVVEVAEQLGMSSLHWEVDPQDWARPGAGAIAKVVSGATAEGAIVLLHDGGGERHGTVQALRRFLPDLAGRLSLDALPAGVDPPWRHGHGLPLKPGQR